MELLGGLGAIAGLASTVYGAIKEGQQRKEMAAKQQGWNAENEALFNKDYYSDYTKRADNQNVIRQMNDQMKKQNQVDQNVAAVTGQTPEAINASKDRRNSAMTNLYGNIASLGAQYKDRVQNRYLNRKQQLQVMDYNTDAQAADSANNLIYNGLKGMATTDWATMLKTGATPTPKPTGAGTGTGTGTGTNTDVNVMNDKSLQNSFYGK